jgi:CubicO group peptidase (beta-lactamase class C family)
MSLVLCLCVAHASAAKDESPVVADDGVPVHRLAGKEMVRDWIVIGPFPNNMLEEPVPGGVMHAGFHADYLAKLGGEAVAVLTPEVEVLSTIAADGSGSVRAQTVSADGGGIINLDALFGKPDNVVAYAFAYIHADTAQTAGFYFGSDDGAKVWVNGDLVNEVYVGRGIMIGQDKFQVDLDEGRNSVLVKVAERAGDWGFALGVADGEAVKSYIAEEEAKQARYAFQDARVAPKDSYMFVPGDFPELNWDKPGIVGQVIGEVPLRVRWFDGELNEVTKAEEPGRYAFVAEGTAADGRVIRRAGTMYCKAPDWMAWTERPTAHVERLGPDSIDRSTWDKHREAVDTHAGRSIRVAIEKREEGAQLLAFLHDMQGTDAPPTASDIPLAREQDYHVALQRKLMGVGDKWPALRAPRQRSDNPATVLHEGTPEEAGVSPDTAEKIHAVCKEWYEQSGEPFVTLVARNGVIVYHEAIGEGPFGEVTRDSTMPLASITKAITGMTFAQFVDQGLIDIDDPVGDYLPDFPTTGDKAITLRHCFTHTTGLTGHAEWGGIHNPRLGNVIANCPEDLTPGKVLVYNGMGYDLAGHVMAVVSGKGIIRVIREQVLDPIGADHTVIEEDLAFSCNTTAYELAMLGQVLANRGSYGELEYFTPETFEKLLPTPLNPYYPDLNAEWGIGLTWMRPANPSAGRKDGGSTKPTLLGDRVIGHGSATSSVLRVDLDNGLVITQVRRRAGAMYDKYLSQLMVTIDDGLIQDE